MANTAYPAESRPAIDAPYPDSTDKLTEALYADLRKLAAQRLGYGNNWTVIQPTVLVHEAWLRVSARQNDWKDRKHFLATLATTMRNILIDRARQKARMRHGGDLARTAFGSLGSIPASAPNERLILVDEGVRELEKVYPLRAKVVVSRFFGGFSNNEIAEHLGISERSVDRHWAAARVWLYRWMQANGQQ